MANSNVNIASKLYAYIKHGVDIDQNIKQIYYNSMIFIGDEQQIYVPVMDTYVGIGMTAYNNTLDRITALEQKIDDVANSLSQDLVSRIYANYSFKDLTYNSYLTSQDKIDNNFDESLTTGYLKWQLNNEVTFKGVNDYNPETGFARKIDDVHPYVIKDADGHEYKLNNKDYTVDHTSKFDARDLYSNSALATSGITITAHYGEEVQSTNPITGQIIKKREGNYIEIDDKLTWSYMTSAYAYTLNYSTNYVNSEVERLYHNLLGDSEASYEMVSFGSVVEDFTYQYSHLTETEKENYNTAHPDTHVIALGPHYVEAGIEYNNPEAPEEGIREQWDAYCASYDLVIKIHTDKQYYYYGYTTANYENASEHDRTGYYIPITGETLIDLLDGDANVPSLNHTFIYHEGETDEHSYLYSNFIYYVDPSLDPTAPQSEVNYLPDGGFPQLYVLDTQYNSSYNMNIKDGIETLKEVAYLLDLLTDGRLGQTTYVTYGDFMTYVGDPDDVNTHWSYSAGVWSYYETSIAELTAGGGEWPDPVETYNVVSPIGSNPNNNDIYVYFVTEEDPENLGIQIAYSIAGNKTEIDDLHRHTDLIEEGKTTLRSIQSTNTNFVSVDLIGGTTHWTNTDANQGEDNFGDESSDDPKHPNYDNFSNSTKVEHNAYQVGDVNIKVSLATSLTYATTYTYDVHNGSNTEPVNYKYTDNYNVVWFGTYTKADMNKLPAPDSDEILGAIYPALEENESPEASDEITTYFVLDSNYENNITGLYAGDGTAVNTIADVPEKVGYAQFRPVTYGEYVNDVKGDRYQRSGEQFEYYWIPNASEAKNDDSQNLKYKSFSVKQYLKLGNAAVLTGDETGVGACMRKNHQDGYTIYLRTKDGEYLPYSWPHSENIDNVETNLDSTQAFIREFYKANNITGFNTRYTLSGDDALGQLTEDSRIYIIDSFSIEPVKVHPIIGTEDAPIDNTLATTEWVDVYLSAKVDEIAEELADILEQAKEYTRQKISELDTNYKFTDFNEYWNYYLSTLDSDPAATTPYGTEPGEEFLNSDIKTPGTEAYNTIYGIEYAKYADDTNANGDPAHSVYTFYVDETNKGAFRLTYQLSSQYAYNIVEEDGIVRPETRELPSDKLVAKFRVWGNENNEDTTKVHQYSNVVLAGSDGEDTTRPFDELYQEDESLFMKLFKWFNTQTAGSTTADKYGDDAFENQLFVADGVEYKPVSLAEVQTMAGGSEADYTAYIFGAGKDNFYYLADPEQNIYGRLANYVTYLSDNNVKVHGNSISSFDYANSNDKYWTRLFVQVPKYVEINLQDAEDTGATTSNSRNALKIKIDESSYYLLMATTPGTQNTTITVGKYVSENNVSVPVYYYDYQFSTTAPEEGEYVTVALPADPNDDNATVQSGLPLLQYISSFAADQKKYLSVENKHYTYEDNGEGDNKFEITAHITNIEDASATNTGFADAFDVQTYVKNFFSWVDVSASVTDDIVNHSDLYYKFITWKEYDEMETKPDLYIRTVNGNNVEYGDGTTAGTPVAIYYTAWYWSDHDEYLYDGSVDSAQIEVGGVQYHIDFVHGTQVGGQMLPAAFYENVGGGHVTKEDIWFHREFIANHDATNGDNGKVYDKVESNYYIRIEEPKINPLNLSITKYGNDETPAPVEP